MLTFDERVRRRVKRKNNRLHKPPTVTPPQAEQIMLPF